MFYPFSKEKIAYSFGINNDTSWEKDMAENGYDIYMYDHTIRALPERNEKFHWVRKGITGGKENKIVIELHGILEAQNRDKILKALKRVRKTHSVVHVHANNYGRVNFCNELITPNALEVTLVRRNAFRTAESDLMLPVMEDMPCNKRAEDIFLGHL